MEGLPPFRPGDSTEEWCVKLSAWLETLPNLEALQRGDVVRKDQNVELSGTLSVAGVATLTGTPVLTGAANGTVACVFTANQGPSGAQTALTGWIPITVGGTPRFIPYW